MGAPDRHSPLATLLVAEDDESSRLALTRSLEKQGYAVVQAADGEAALAALDAQPIDLVLLDIGMPRLDGLGVITALRQTHDLPVIVLSGRAEEVDLVIGLELGADDYLVKPYSLRELVARVRARLRRVPGPEGPSTTIRFGDVGIDALAREVTVAGTLVSLTPREFDLLAFLAAHPREVFTRERLLEHVWGTRFADPSTVTEHLRRVRTKIERLTEQRNLVTLRGSGYRFDP